MDSIMNLYQIDFESRNIEHSDKLPTKRTFFCVDDLLSKQNKNKQCVTNFKISINFRFLKLK